MDVKCSAFRAVILAVVACTGASSQGIGSEVVGDQYMQTIAPTVTQASHCESGACSACDSCLWLGRLRLLL